MTLLRCTRATAEIAATSLASRLVPDFRLKAYFATECLVDAVLETYQIFHLPGYVSIYLAMRPLNFLAMLWVAPPTLAGAITAVFLTYSAYLWIPPDMLLVSLPALVQGCLYVLCGASCVNKYPILAVTWLLLGLFNYSFAIGWKLPEVAALNQWWCAAVAVTGFTLFAWRASSRPQPHPAQLLR